MNDKIFSVPYIRGVSAVVPKEKLSIKTLDFGKTAMKNIMSVTGISEIRQAAADKTVSDYCASAAENLISDLAFDKSELDGIVFATFEPDYQSPGAGYIIHDRLGLSKKCIVVDINQACAGFVNGLFQAFMLIQSGYCKNVLLCVACNQTKLVHPKDKSLRMLMGDAGAAAIISADEKINPSTFAFHNDGAGVPYLYIPAGGGKLPRKIGVTDAETSDEQGNIRTAENLFMNGLDVMAFAMESVPETVAEVLEKINWLADEVDLFFFHQANKFMVDSLRKRLHLPEEKVSFTMENFGNTSCVSIPLEMCLLNNPEKKFLNKVILCGFGSGMACAAAALSLEKTFFSELREL